MQYAVEGRCELARRQRFLQDLAGARFSGPLSHRRAKIAAHEQDRNRRPDRPHLANQLGPRRAGHAFVGDDRIELLGIGDERVERRSTGGETNGVVSELCQRLRSKPHQRLFVVHD